MMRSTIDRMCRRDFVRLTAVAGAAAAVHVPRRASAQPPKRGGTLKIVGLEPPSFDIHGTVSYQTQILSSCVHRGLFKFVNGAKYGPSDFTLVPDLALRADVSADGKTYTIKLRPGV